MKSMDLFKLLLVLLPAMLLIYVFLIRGWLDNTPGIGGGGYDLTNMYTLAGTGMYLVVLNLFFLIQGAIDNKYYLLAGILLLVIVVVIAVRTF
ncbi:hypothetical protein [Chitinophaga rhizophila]|uniref:Uncharacterized protein n=1 Tax=Chitinophaga rhizophila TaxID=2866212 RepID=A0ABS7GCW8_9BACT|nr:hypothetical protein [Chitinophaga rhizophila]MBW8684358.1 hypothetical protein [Chitinophaga rhizophila]